MPAFKEVRDLPFSISLDGSTPRPSPLWGEIPKRLTFDQMADAVESVEEAILGEMRGAAWGMLCGEATDFAGCLYAYFPLGGNPVPQILISVAEALRIGPRKVGRAIRAASEGRDPWEELDRD